MCKERENILTKVGVSQEWKTGLTLKSCEMQFIILVNRKSKHTWSSQEMKSIW